MENTKSLAAVMVVTVAVAGSLWGQSEWKLRQLAQRGAHLNAPRVPPQARAAWPQENKQLAQLWLGRQQRDVTSELLELLQNSQHPDIRHRVVRVLGRLENPKTLGQEP